MLCFRTVQMLGGTMSNRAPAEGIDGFLQWELPYLSYSAAELDRAYGQRFMLDRGMTRSQLGQIALNGRRNANGIH